MNTFRSVIWSSVGKKYISGITGLALFLFVMVHLLGNLSLLIGGEAFNHYAHFLESLVHGWFVYAAEAGLIVIFVLHIAAGIAVTLDKWKARPVGYKKTASAGGASKKTISSATMIYTGLIILVFLPIHVLMFKFGDTGTVVSGSETIKNLFGLVSVDFTDPVAAFGYVFVMIVLGFHLRHGFWSAFQSLGLNSDRSISFLNGLGFLLAGLLALGFLILPLYFYFVY